MRLLPLLLLLACTASDEADDGDTDAVGNIVGLPTPCDDDTGAYAALTGTWNYDFGGVRTPDWNLGLTWGAVDASYGLLSVYGCVIDGGAQTYEASFLFGLPVDGGTDFTVSTDFVDEVDTMQGALNRNLAGDNDAYDVPRGLGDIVQIDRFDPVAGVFAGSFSVSSPPLAQNEPDDVAEVLTVDWDVAWTP